jgi:hypothetical protein
MPWQLRPLRYSENCLPLLDALQDANDAIAMPGHPHEVLQVTAPMMLIHSFLGSLDNNFNCSTAKIVLCPHDF